jgi:hypothetical protein
VPRAIGNDRLEVLQDGSFELHSTLDKGWKARRDRTRTTAEFPGTPVRWEDEWYEVVSLRRLPDDRRIYVLARWQERHPIRNPSQYDEASERNRHQELARAHTRAEHTKGVLLAGLIIGHIPAHAQREIESEYGVLGVRLSLVSLILPILFATWVAYRLGGAIIDPSGSKPGSFEILFGLFMAFESVFRLNIILSKSSPCGSTLGLLVYDVWRLVTKRGRAFEARAAAVAEERLASRASGTVDAATAERDAYEIRLPFLALLSPQEQSQLRETFGFDPGKWGLRTALVIGLFAALGCWTSLATILGGRATFSTWSSLLVASALLFEQIRRVVVVSGGKPAGSIAGALVRPLCRKLLAARPTALKKGTVEPAPRRSPDMWDGDVPDDYTGR